MRCIFSTADSYTEELDWDPKAFPCSSSENSLGDVYSLASSYILLSKS